MQGNFTTVPITLDEMIVYGKTVARGAKRAMVLIDMPFGTYKGDPYEAQRNAIKIMQQTGADGVKQIKQSQDSCPPGVTCIMDFANDSAQGMEPLYRALSQVNSLGRPVRIAVLGDSYIEGDIVTAKLRELLQKRFGGHGAGLVPITSDSPGFRHTIGHTFGNWESHHGNDHSRA